MMRQRQTRRRWTIVFIAIGVAIILGSRIHARQATVPATTQAAGSETITAEQLDELSRRVGYDRTSPDARKWWDGIVADNPKRRGMLKSVCDELQRRNATLEQLYHTYYACEAEIIQGNLEYLDYWLNVYSDIEQMPGDSNARATSTTGAANTKPSTAKVTPGQSSDDDQPIEELRRACGWEATTPEVRQWWLEFENAPDRDPALVRAVLRSLRADRNTITHLFLARMSSRALNARATLAYLHYTRFFPDNVLVPRSSWQHPLMRLGVTPVWADFRDANLDIWEQGGEGHREIEFDEYAEWRYHAMSQLMRLRDAEPDKPRWRDTVSNFADSWRKRKIDAGQVRSLFLRAYILYAAGDIEAARRDVGAATRALGNQRSRQMDRWRDRIDNLAVEIEQTSPADQSPTTQQGRDGDRR